jgi:phosphatidylserine/phosphatidylglycerophosphate/cardiolipin synthase-like enzyme
MLMFTLVVVQQQRDTNISYPYFQAVKHLLGVQRNVVGRKDVGQDVRGPINQELRHHGSAVQIQSVVALQLM